jgi:membrane-bound serine protease (ClpP class)
MNRARYLLLISSLLLALFMSPAWADGKAYVVDVEGAIGPVSHDLITRAIDDAESDSATMVVLLMNTPGGLDHSMRKIIAAILDSEIPVVSYVYPPGSRAASAGTYILYASHVAAMSPATNLGAATPVQLGGLPEMPATPKPAAEEGGEDEAEMPAQGNKTSMEKKVINDASAYIRGLAKLRDRNEEWAVKAVREGVSLTAEEALEMSVIDLMADSVADLFKQLHGRSLNLKDRSVTLDTEALIIERIKPDWRSQLLSVITDPNIAYILMLVGVYGLIIELSNPGGIVAGVIGSICLLLALYAFQVLPINYAGLALVGIGLAFIVSEMFITSGGILGIGGVVAFVIGSIILFDDKYLAVSLPLIGGVAAIAAGFLLWIIRRLSTIRHKQVVSGLEYLIGQVAEVTHDFTGQGRVRVEGESWLAESTVPLTAGQKVRIKDVQHLVLKVESIDATDPTKVKS